jgi:excisionase family DNA binding protein
VAGAENRSVRARGRPSGAADQSVGRSARPRGADLKQAEWSTAELRLVSPTISRRARGCATLGYACDGLPWLSVKAMGTRCCLYVRSPMVALRSGDPFDSPLLTVTEACRLLKVHRTTIWRWIRAGRLPAYRLGPRELRLRRDDVARLLVREGSAPASAGSPLDREDAGAALLERMRELRELLAGRGGAGVG